MSEILEYSHTEAALTLLRQNFSDATYDVTTTAGMVAARQARAEIKGYRTALEAKRKELKAPALEHTRLIDAEAKRITAELLLLEEPIDAQIKAEEDRKAAEKAQKEKENQERIANILGAIEQIKAVPMNVADHNSGSLMGVVHRVTEYELTPEYFGEFFQAAFDAKQSTLEKLSALHLEKLTQETAAAERQADEKEKARVLAEAQAKLAEERAAFDLQVAEVKRLQAEDDRKAAETKAAAQAILDAEAAAAKKIADELAETQRAEAQKLAVEAEEKRVKAEAKAKAELKARKLAEARCDDATEALRKILDICNGASLNAGGAIEQIILICEGNI